MLYSVVVLFPTTCDSGRQSGKHIWCEWPIALIHTPYILTSGTDIYGNPDAFSATGFEKRMSIFSQEMRALLLHVHVVVMEVLVYDMCGWGSLGCVCSHMPELSWTLTV